ASGALATRRPPRTPRTAVASSTWTSSRATWCREGRPVLIDLGLARLGHGTLASLHPGASPARSTACVGIAGGSETILVRMVATGKTRARPGTWSWGGPRGSRGGPRAGARSPDAGL